jgi:hypothetical protein
LTLLVSVTISLVGKSDAESPGCSAAIGGVTSVIECPDPIPAIGFVELSHLLTTVFGGETDMPTAVRDVRSQGKAENTCLH